LLTTIRRETLNGLYKEKRDIIVDFPLFFEKLWVVKSSLWTYLLSFANFSAGK
jgi:hypothetical protein